MDAYEWSCWEALAGIDPFGEERDDWRAAHLASTIANFAGKTLRDTVPTGDFLMRFKEPETEEFDVATKLSMAFGRLMARQNAGKK